MISFHRLSTIAFRALVLVLPHPAQSFSNFNLISASPSLLPTNPLVSKQPSSLSLTALPNDSDSGEDDGNLPPTLESLAKDLANSKYKNIVVLIGAGMSVSAGIPDFRTPGTGLYSRLEEYNLPYPEAIFELGYFKQNPAPFVDVAKAIWPGQTDGPQPTLAHSFVALLEKRGLLKRVYSQNIDGLEKLAGVSQDRLIECHGHFSTCSCIKFMCKRKGDIDPQACQDSYVTKGEVMKCPDCGSFVKPDIVFFGEELPAIFVDNINQDTDDCDLLIVMGTSLLVAPVASIPNWVGKKVPRLLVNRDLVGSFATAARKAENIQGYQTRDVFVQGDCDDGAQRICELAGKDWAAQLDEMHTAASAE